MVEANYKEITKLLHNLNPHDNKALTEELWLQRTVLEIEIEGQEIGRELVISSFKNAIQRQNMLLHFKKILFILDAGDKVYG
jgi:hypothetical protein